MENAFNLVDERWIPVAGKGRVSLVDFFSRPDMQAFSGNAIQKLSLTKLVLSIAQAACTIKDENEWKALGVEGMSRQCLDYLDKWHDRFYLYGDRPFLQMPAIADRIEERTNKKLEKAKTKGKREEIAMSGDPKKIGAGFYPDVPADNNTLLSHALFDKPSDDAEKALFLLTLMNFAFAGKRTEVGLKSLAGRSLGSHHSASAGPSIGGWDGYLHTMVATGSLRTDIWLNLLTDSDIEVLHRWPAGMGRPAWEEMPQHEEDAIAERLQESYQGSLVAMSRFVLLKDDGVFYLDGIRYPSVKSGWFEPTLLINYSGKDAKVKYANIERKPWRELHSFLDFLSSSNSSGFESYALKKGVSRMRDIGGLLCVWSGGIKVSANSGDQSAKQSDDFVESSVWLDSADLGSVWINNLEHEMSGLEHLSKMLYACIQSYYRKNKATPNFSKARAALATSLFWYFCEDDFPDLASHCGQNVEDANVRAALRKRFFSHVSACFDRYAPKNTARQIEAWAYAKPSPGTYLSELSHFAKKETL